MGKGLNEVRSLPRLVDHIAKALYSDVEQLPHPFPGQAQGLGDGLNRLGFFAVETKAASQDILFSLTQALNKLD